MKIEKSPWIIINRLADIVLNYVPGCIVEIGLGRSTKILNKHAKNYSRIHYACDTNLRVCDFVRKECSNNLIIWHGKSYDFINNFENIPALVFLDGRHDYKTLFMETKFFIDKLAVGGILFIHDTFLADKLLERYQLKGKLTTAYRVRQIVEKMNSVYCITFPYTANNCGLTMVIKKEPYPPTERM